MEINRNTNYYLELLVTNTAGNGVTGLTITYEIIKSLDNSVIDSGTLSDVGNGIYQDSYVFDTLGQYRILYYVPSPYSNEIESILITDTYDKIERILGLSQENYKLFDPTWDADSNMTSCTIRTYPTPADCNADTNPLASYQMTAVYLHGRTVSYKVVEV